MRDPKRISRILDLVRTLWTYDLDLRFFQFIGSLKFKISGSPDTDLFYFEDDELEEELIRLINEDNIVKGKP